MSKLLILLVAVALLAGCGNQKKDEAQPRTLSATQVAKELQAALPRLGDKQLEGSLISCRKGLATRYGATTRCMAQKGDQVFELSVSFTSFSEGKPGFIVNPDYNYRVPER